MTTGEDLRDAEPADGEPLGTVRWFGVSWGAPVCRPANRVDPPVGMPCVMGDGSIDISDTGVRIPNLGGTRGAFSAYHLGCFFDQLGLDTSGKWTGDR